MGADIHQVPPYAIEQLDEAEDMLKQSCRWVAKALAMAHPDEQALDSPVLHDLQADMPRATAAQLPRGPLVQGTRVKPDLEAELVVEGERRQHLPKLISKKPPLWRCEVCCKPGVSREDLHGHCYGAHHLLSRIHSSHVMWRHAGDEEFMFRKQCAGWTGPKKVSAKLSNPCMGVPVKPSDLEKLMAGNVIVKGKTFYKGAALPVQTGVGTTSTRGSTTAQGADQA